MKLLWVLVSAVGWCLAAGCGPHVLTFGSEPIEGDAALDAGLSLGRFPKADPLASGPAEGGSCAHDVCETGAPLDPACDPCVAAFCADAAEAHCCADGWDISCAAAAQTACSRSCDNSTGTCGQNLCKEGPAVDARDVGTACSLCAFRVCQDIFRPSCCEAAWGISCVELLGQVGAPCEACF